MERGVRLKGPCRVNQQLANNELSIIYQSSENEDLKSSENGR